MSPVGIGVPAGLFGFPLLPIVVSNFAPVQEVAAANAPLRNVSTIGATPIAPRIKRRRLKSGSGDASLVCVFSIGFPLFIAFSPETNLINKEPLCASVYQTRQSYYWLDAAIF
ncbi:MAG: hypothetical protein ACXWTK_04135 [Methylobacter sp.]